MGTRLREIRKRLGLNQFDVARRSKIHPATISKIETGRYRPYPVELQRLARALRVDPKDLQDQEGEDA